MKFEIENNIISSYKRLSYQPWYAFAEFVDNSTQSFIDNEVVLNEIYEKTGEKLSIIISYDKVGDKIIISDNSIGMNEEDLTRAFKVGQPPENPNGRSRYGLGMKTAACWFGNNWTVKTKKLDSDYSFTVNIDVDQIAKQTGEVDLEIIKEDSDKKEHYTVITITDLNRKFAGMTLWKIKNYLSSIYRFDLQEGTKISWNNETLSWVGFDNELHVSTDGVKFYKEFSFEIEGKPVRAWVGVLGKGFGSRRKAGFSIIQNKRVIENSYKPISIFGEQEEGGNDLINQRIVGEIFLEKFSVSHTKDKIVWESDEEDVLNQKMGEYCADAKEKARTLRFNTENNVEDKLGKFKEFAVSIIESELKSSEIINYITTVEPYPEKVIHQSYANSIKSSTIDKHANINVEIGSNQNKILVSVYFSEKSEFEPYVLSETTIEDNRVIVIINLLHPHVTSMNEEESFTNFLRESIYDGVAEWKAIKLMGSIQPNTIKFLKDGLLRIPFEIRENKV